MSKINTEVGQNFTDAAKAILTHYKSPTQFLKFINNAMGWCHNLFFDKKSTNDSEYFVLHVIINDFLLQWIEGGNNEPKNLAIGLKKVYDYGGSYCISEAINLIMEGLIHDEADGSISFPDAMGEKLKGLTALCDVNRFFHKEDMSKNGDL